MKSIPLQLATDERIALRRLAHELGKPLEEAAQVALRDWLIAHGHLELLTEIDTKAEKASDP